MSHWTNKVDRQPSPQRDMSRINLENELKRDFSLQLCADCHGTMTTATGVKKTAHGHIMYDLICIFTPDHDLDQL